MLGPAIFHSLNYRTGIIYRIAFAAGWRNDVAVRPLAAASPKNNRMQKFIGFISLVAGLTALWFGHTAAQAVNSKVKALVEGAPTDRATYFYIGGIALTLFGILKLLLGKKK